MLTIHVDLPDAAYDPLKDLLHTTAGALRRDLQIVTDAMEGEADPVKLGHIKAYGEKTTKQLLIVKGLLAAMPKEKPPEAEPGLIVPATGGDAEIKDLLVGAKDWRPGRRPPGKKVRHA